MWSGKLEHLQEALADQRSRRVVFVSHCILNENVRYLGGAGRPGCVNEVVDRLQADGTGICQMPCPEQRAWGGVAKRWLVPVYGSKGSLIYRLRRPLAWAFVWWTRLVYARLARRIAREAADYARSGVEVAGVVGIGASPSCGVSHTMDVGRALEVIASCPVAVADASRFNAALLGSARIAGEGMFIQALRRALDRRGLGVPFAEHDLAAELKSAVPGAAPPRDSRASTRGPTAHDVRTIGSGAMR